MQKITPFLWYDGNAEEAVNFYVSIFKNSKVVSMARYGDAGPGPKGSVMTAAFQLDGQDFVALNGGPQFKFTPAISFVVNCESQQEVDELWEKPFSRRTKKPVRLAAGQIWRLVANCSHNPEQAHAGQRSGKIKAGDAGNAADGQNRYQQIAAGF
jgi:predicted 3-demethylubiquinone-9 3-methyltransferase (glyoxalase superfamily)